MSSVTDILDDLRTLGRRITELDLGYQIEPARFNPPAAPDDVTSLVVCAGQPLPDDYREFLLSCAGFAGMDFHNGYEVFDPQHVLRLLDQDFQPHRVIVDGSEHPVLSVAGDGGGNLFLLQLAVPWRVWKWDHELPEGPVVDSSSRALSEVVHGFGAFLRRVTEDWRHFLEDDEEEWDYLVG